MERKVVVVPSSLSHGEFPIEVLNVPCEKHGWRQVFVRQGLLFELSLGQRKLGSWFMDESVEMNGKLYMATPMDIVFVFLPLLEKNEQQFRPFSDMVSEAHSSLVRLSSLINNVAEQCRVVCDVKDIPGLSDVVVRLNRDKLFKWLLCKVDVLVEAFKKTDMIRSASQFNASRSRQLVSSSSSKESSDNDEALLFNAVELVKDYISEAWSRSLMDHFQLKSSESSSSSLNFNLANRQSSGGAAAASSSSSSSSSSAVQPQSASAKRFREQDVSNTKPITSFFTKKPKQ